MSTPEETFVHKYAILVPVYNEEKTIQATIDRLDALQVPYLIIDDGSTDSTWEILQKNQVPAYHYSPNIGKGMAIKIGFAELLDLGYEWVMIYDGDNQFDEKAIERLDNELLFHEQDCDMIICDRFRGNTNMPWLRRKTNEVLSWFISKLTGVYFPDTQCGLRLIHKNIPLTIEVPSNRFDFETELLVKAIWGKFRVRSIPIDCKYFADRKSKIKIWRDTWRMLKLLGRLFCVRQMKRLFRNKSS